MPGRKARNFNTGRAQLRIFEKEWGKLRSVKFQLRSIRKQRASYRDVASISTHLQQVVSFHVERLNRRSGCEPAMRPELKTHSDANLPDYECGSVID